jgi:class 3 adenylate cyclase
MADNTNRTFICSVLFLDIVEYSRRSVTEQLKLKEQFNTTLSEAISGVAVDDRIILDTGDGAAVSFLGDPEDAMFVALSMRDAIASQADGGPLLRVRFGINLGPVRLIKDINGQPNIIGDGINVAQRIMTFAEPGQILVSRSYYDIIARLSEDYANLFHYEGARTDKHVREHEVYAVGAAPRRLRTRTQPPPPRRASVFPAFKLNRLAGGLAVDGKLLIVAPLAFVFIVGSAFAVRSYRKAEQATLVAVAPVSRAARAEPARVAATEEARPAAVEDRTVKPAAKAPPKEAAKPKAQKPPTREELAAKREKERQEAAAKKEKERQELAAKKEKEKQELAAKKEKDRLELAALAERKAAKERDAIASGPPGTLQISVLPWGEVFVDGKKLGVSPPLHSVPISPGKHQVELRNASFPAHRQTLNVKPGESIIVSHRFR